MSSAGRPPRSGERKEDQITVRLTGDEKAPIDAAAAAASKPSTDWVRDLALAAATEELPAAAAEKAAANPAPKKVAKKKA